MIDKPYLSFWELVRWRTHGSIVDEQQLNGLDGPAQEEVIFNETVAAVLADGVAGRLEVFDSSDPASRPKRIPTTSLDPERAIVYPLGEDGEAELHWRERQADLYGRVIARRLCFRVKNVLVAWPSLQSAERPALRRDVEALYLARRNEYLLRTGRPPTFKDDIQWGYYKGILRGRIRELRRTHNTPDEQKGGAPKRRQ